jgi:hypothetical protein
MSHARIFSFHTSYRVFCCSTSTLALFYPLPLPLPLHIPLYSRYTHLPTSAPQPMFPTGDEAWGDLAHGWTHRDQCSALPKYPMCGKSEEDNLQDLCEWTFDFGLKEQSASGKAKAYPIIKNACQVTCPWQLWQSTSLHRSDEPSINDFQCSESKSVYRSDLSGGTDPYQYLKGIMDCGKPFYASASNLPTLGASFYSGHNLVIPCRRDGYQRVNTAPTSRPTSIPTEAPTSMPTAPPSSIPSRAPADPSSQPSSAPTHTPAPSPEPTAAPVLKLSMAESLSGDVKTTVEQSGGWGNLIAMTAVGGVAFLFCCCFVPREYYRRVRESEDYEDRKIERRASRRHMQRMFYAV